MNEYDQQRQARKAVLEAKIIELGLKQAAEGVAQAARANKAPKRTPDEAGACFVAFFCGSQA